MAQWAHQTTAGSTAPVIVIGAGMVGVATAIWLQRSGHRVTLIDKGGADERSSYGNAGVLASSSVIPVTTPGLVRKAPGMLISKNEPVFLRCSYLLRLLPWGVRYLSHANEADARRTAAALTPIIGNSLADHQELAAGTAAQSRIKPCDFTVLFKDRAAFDKDPLPWDIRRTHGFFWTELQGAQRRAHDPAIDSAFDFMALLGGHGQLNDPGAYLSELLMHFVSKGGRHLKEEVIDIAQENAQVSGVRTTSEFMPASAVAITAGAWSPLLTRKLGVSIPLEAESGYHIELWGADRMPRSPTLFPAGKFILTPMEGRLRVAGAVEFGGLDNPGSRQPKVLLKAGLDKLMPGLKYEHETQWIGHRPAPTDSVPIIDQMSSVSGVFVGCGHQHVGVTGSARTGQLLAELISGRATGIDMTPYRLDRFGKRWRQPVATVTSTPMRSENA